MMTVFADSFYVFALANPNDPAHAKAVTFTQPYRGRTVTTGWVIAELGDGWTRPQRWRQEFVQMCASIRANPNIAVEPVSDALLADGIDLFGRRLDKEWSLTACISFVVMDRHGLTEALTGDRHFEQAGFAALLK